MSNGRLIPNSIESEQAVLGGLLIDPGGMVKVGSIIKPKDFYETRHRIIFDCIQRVFESGDPIDLITVSEALKKEGKLEEAGGSSYLMDLSYATPSAANLEYYAKIVEEKSILRGLIEIGIGISNKAYLEEADASEVLDEAEKSIFNIASSKTSRGFTHIKDIINPVLNKLEQISKSESGITGIPTGFYDLDKLTAGFQRSDLIILAARPSVGKSSLGINIACNIAIRNQQSVAIFSLEMSKESLVERMIASEARVNAQDMRRGQLQDEAWVRIGHIMNNLPTSSIYIDDSADLTVLELRAKARKLSLERELSLIIVDYLQLLRTNQKVENRVQEISQITRSLKALARELNVPILVQSQLSRSIETRTDRRPVLSDLRESGSIEQDADIVMFLSPPESEKDRGANVIDLILAKQRNGPVGMMKLKFLRTFTRFESLAAMEGPPPDFD